MVPDLACFALLLAHDHESVKRKDFFPFCGLKIANTASLVIDQASVIAYPYSSFWQKHQRFSSLSFSVWLPGLSSMWQKQSRGNLHAPTHVTTTLMT